MSRASQRVTVVGSGPNGLAAAMVLARAGLEVLVREAQPTLGGGARSAELTRPGYVHDLCSTVHPLLLASPFFRDIGLDRLGVRVVQPDIPFAHPLDGGRAAVVHRSLETTCAGLGLDGAAYRRTVGPLARHWQAVVDAVLQPLRGIPDRPLGALRMAPVGLRSAAGLAGSRFVTDEARAVLAGAAAHSMLPLDRPPTAALGGLLGLLAHAVGWPLVEGGSQRLVDAMVADVRAHGGEVVAASPVRSLAELDGGLAVLDVTPRQLLDLAGDRMPPRAARALGRYRYGPGVFKVDWALSGPVPWANPDVRRAGTVHVGGPLEEVARSEAEVNAGRHPERPYVLCVQPTVADPTRAPAGGHVFWAYCHVPSGSTVDMTERIEAQIERFAPGFRDLVVERATSNSVEHERDDWNFVGGDINGGVQDIRQTVFRPTVRWDPYRTALPGVWLCSSSTPPGGGVHGMAGYGAARSLLRSLG